jgi:cytosine/adenosine deaminase-related metal-dependent hydrolase
MSNVIRAQWILPIDGPPIENGWIETADDRIVRVGRGRAPARARDLGHAAVLPRLVNAHTHLELSWMAGRVPPAGSMVDWIEHLLAVRAQGSPGGEETALAAARAAAAALHAAGTVLVGDISNRLTTVDVLHDAGLGGVVFHELLGFVPADPDGMVRDAWSRILAMDDAGVRPPRAPLTFSLSAHAPYSVSPELFRAIARRVGRRPLAVHLAESPEEVEFLHTGQGRFRELLERLDLWTGRWEVPRCDPVGYLASLGYLQAGLLVVHGVYLSNGELERLRDAGAVLVTCPRSNEWVGAGPPRLSRMYDTGISIAVGTDSLASAASLSLFDELAEMRRIAPDVEAPVLLQSATRTGAEALGLGAAYGTIAAGKRAVFAVVAIPDGVRDVEEYLVSGVPADRIGLAG